MKFRGDFLGAPSGSVGGLTFSHNRGGYYIRQRVKPTDPNSIRQQAVRNAMRTLVPAWSALADYERADWSLYAQNTPVTNAMGDVMVLTGQQMFIKMNTPRLVAGIPTVSAAPTIFNLGDIGTIGITALDSDVQALTWTFENGDPWNATAGNYMLIFAGKPVNPSVNFYKGPFRFVAKVQGAVVPLTSPQTTDLGASGYTYTEGQAAAFRFVLCNVDGRTTPGQIIGPVIAADV